MNSAALLQRLPAPAPSWKASADVLVVGTGVAGLTAALDAAEAGLRVLVVTKGDADDANTYWAQGGVAVVGPVHAYGDSVELHIEDTLVAGAGLCDVEAVRTILAEGRRAIDHLVSRGAHFDTEPAFDVEEPWVSWARTKEGGHSASRVIHAGGDATGAEIERALIASSASLAILAEHTVVDVTLTEAGSAGGVTVVDEGGRVGLLRAPAVVLATGGAGHLYAVTTNPDVATGDGVAMALRAGAAAADLEFMQFHPTVLYTGPGDRGHRPLVTEAVRGEGAVLVDASGAPIMTGVHPLADLAPRDVVSLAVTRRLAEAPGGIDDHVFLDATGIAPGIFARRFPTVSAACAEIGIDPNVDPIPVAPAAHYNCGGVSTDLAGRTTVPGLYAAGEVARTGLHGANRLASNSLLEGLVMGHRVLGAILADRAHPVAAPLVESAGPSPGADPCYRAALQTSMSRYAGIGRDAAGLSMVLESVQPSPTGSHQPSRSTIEAANLATVSACLAATALARPESRGCHVRTDAPDSDDARRHPLVVRLTDGRIDVSTRPIRELVTR